MNQLPPSESAYNVGRQAHDEGLQDDGDLLNTVLSMPVSKHRIVTRTPEEPFRLNFVDVTCLVVNRTIGKPSCAGIRVTSTYINAVDQELESSVALKK